MWFWAMRRFTALSGFTKSVMHFLPALRMQEMLSHVTVKPYLFFRHPVLSMRNLPTICRPGRDLVVSYGGIGVNLAAALVTG